MHKRVATSTFIKPEPILENTEPLTEAVPALLAPAMLAGAMGAQPVEKPNVQSAAPAGNTQTLTADGSITATGTNARGLLDNVLSQVTSNSHIQPDEATTSKVQNFIFSQFMKVPGAINKGADGSLTMKLNPSQVKEIVKQLGGDLTSTSSSSTNNKQLSQASGNIPTPADFTPMTNSQIFAAASDQSSPYFAHGDGAMALKIYNAALRQAQARQ